MTFSKLARAVLLGATLTFAAGTGTAFAHASLVSSEPAADATAAAPTELKLTFSEGVELAFSEFRLTGADDAEVELGEPALAPEDDKSVVVPVPVTLAPGDYTVEWSVVSADGHKIEDSFGFTVAAQ